MMKTDSETALFWETHQPLLATLLLALVCALPRWSALELAGGAAVGILVGRASEQWRAGVLLPRLWNTVRACVGRSVLRDNNCGRN